MAPDTGEWKLRGEAEWVFGLADKDGAGSADVTELAELLSKSMVLRSALEPMEGGVASLHQWLVYFKAQEAKNASAAKKLLKQLAKHLGAALEFEAWKEEQVRSEPRRPPCPTRGHAASQSAS